MSDLSEEEKEALAEHPVPLVELIQPLIEVLAKVNNKDHYKRIIDNVFEPLMDMLDATRDDQSSKKRRKLAHEDDENGEETDEQILLRGQPQSLKLDILKSMFNTGARDDTDPVNRKRLYKFAAEHGLDE